ncbi:phosphotriesterase family protein [Geodermatophilus marinus]|uniref:phosphotriesterase family protein n=1 Tax=Geodermatophilus sp. LHW52908 TaxID=2303986 RepID=UPI000E3ECB2A|nr:phosphotriesterase [Geodermatophilus sp. LHW52908]RFU20552.1 phosphotriesterase [Geodermatophilus sp. LHW52908]
MPQVQTVRGPVDTAGLGQVLMHEHLFVLDPEIQHNHPEEWGSESDRVADAVARLIALAGTGVRTIVDPTVLGMGRYIPRIQEIAAQVDLNIIVATGYYTYDHLPFYFQYRGPALAAITGTEVPDPMVDMFVRDIEQGIADTGVRAALLKCAIDHQGMTSNVERVLRAVARAHRRTGAPITVHTHPGSRQGSAVAQVLADEGVDPRRVVLGHSGDTTDIAHLSELADAGFTLGMDRFGVYLETSFEDRAGTVAEMCRRGFAEHMVLSHDAACYYDAVPPELAPMFPAWHYTHIHEEVLPYLRQHGVTDEQVETMLVDNPRRYFESTGRY